MKLVLIYGPAATGKLTIAKQLAQKTGFRLFHNHVSIDVAKVLFDFNTKEFGEIVWDVRMMVFEAAAKCGVSGLIFTWAYSHPNFLPYLDRMRQTLAKYQTEICYVFVSCSLEELKRRVVHADRGEIGKINSVEALEEQLIRKNHQVIPDTDSLVIDNTELSPEDVAERIMTHFGFVTK